jgi:hypothetical protein
MYLTFHLDYTIAFHQNKEDIVLADTHWAYPTLAVHWVQTQGQILEEEDYQETPVVVHPLSDIGHLDCLTLSLYLLHTVLTCIWGRVVHTVLFFTASNSFRSWQSDCLISGP